MIKVPLELKQYDEMGELIDRSQAASDAGDPGMVIAQICTGPETGSMNVFFLPGYVAIEIQKVLAKYSKNPVKPGTVIFKSR